MTDKKRNQKWVMLFLAGLGGGFSFGNGCTLEGFDGLIIRIDNDDDDPDNLIEWLEDRWDDREDFWDHVF